MPFRSGEQRWRAAVLVVAALWPCCSFAEATIVVDPVSEDVVPRAAEASVSHAAAKGLTLKIGSALNKILIFSAGTGSVIAGGALTMLTAASSYALYVTNEYLWDTYSPNTNLAANNANFDASVSLWRNTKKYLTLKPVGMVASWSLIYAYTGSWTATLAMGSASSLAGPLIFYANNIGWDWYDWYCHPANAAQPTPTVPEQQRPLPGIAIRRGNTLALVAQ